MTTPSLFAMANAADIDQQIVDLLRGQRGASDMLLRTEEAAVLRAIRYHRGAGSAIGIRELRSRLKLGEREIKQIVRTLRINFRLPIGSSKHSATGGYFIIVSIEDQEIAAKGPLDQIRAEAEVLKVVTSPERTKELLGQIQLEVR